MPAAALRRECDGLSRLHQSSHQDRHVPRHRKRRGGIGTTTYYHNLQVEVGGATPDRMFSYYVGIGGYNQDYRYLDQFNGSNLGDVWGYPAIAFNTIEHLLRRRLPDVRLHARRQGPGYYDGPNASPVYDPFTLSPGQPGYVPLPNGVHGNDPGCYQTLSPA